MIWGTVASIGVGIVSNIIGSSSSASAQQDIAQQQIAADREMLEMSLAASAGMVEAQIAASYDIFYKQQAAQYDIFNKQQEGAYEIYNAQQAAAYQTLIQQFEFQKTSDIKTAQSGVRIANIEAGALKAAAKSQMKANTASTQIMMEAGYDAASVEASGIREGASITRGQDMRNIGLFWDEAVENLRRTANQQEQTKAITRAIAGGSGGAMSAGSSNKVFYEDMSAEMFAQYNWMVGAYTSQKDTMMTTAEENYSYALKQADALLDIANIQNKALWDSNIVQNAALWESAVIEGSAAVATAKDTLRTVEDIYSRNYFTAPEVLTYTPTSPPGGEGGGGGGGGGYEGGSSSSSSGGSSSSNSGTQTLYHVGGGSAFDISYEQFKAKESYYGSSNLFYTGAFGNNASWYSNSNNTPGSGNATGTSGTGGSYGFEYGSGPVDYT